MKNWCLSLKNNFPHLVQIIGIRCHCLLHSILQILKGLIVPHTGHWYKYFLIWCLVGSPSSFNIWWTRCLDILIFLAISDIVINKLESRSSLICLRTTDLDKEIFVLVITTILYSYLFKNRVSFLLWVSYTLKYYTWVKIDSMSYQKALNQKTRALENENRYRKLRSHCR